MSREVHAAATVVAEAARDGVRRIAQVHGAIARRSWRPAGPVGAPSKAAHDVVTDVVYTSVDVGLAVGGAVAAQALDMLARSGRGRELSASPSGVAALAVLGAVAGDRLAGQDSPLALPMTVRYEGRALPLEPLDSPEAPGSPGSPGSPGPPGSPESGGRPEARTAGPGVATVVDRAAGDVVVFVHGLAGTERAWWWGGPGEDGTPRPSYGDRLRDERGVTPVYVRYNTGLPIADNGRQLADLLDRLTVAWPVPVQRLHLVGHSMGGLVVRSACHVGAGRGDDWTTVVDHCVYLGTPHLGAPLARLAVALGSLGARVPELRPFAALLARPSAGIRDLRFGLPLTAGTDEADPADWFGRDLAEVPLLPTARHHAVVAALTGRAGSPLDRLLGDLLVLTASAAGNDGTRRRIGLAPGAGATVAPANHFSLLNHPAVLDELRAWLGEPPVLAPDDALTAGCSGAGSVSLPPLSCAGRSGCVAVGCIP